MRRSQGKKEEVELNPRLLKRKIREAVNRAAESDGSSLSALGSDRDCNSPCRDVENNVKANHSEKTSGDKFYAEHCNENLLFQSRPEQLVHVSDNLVAPKKHREEEVVVSDVGVSLEFRQDNFHHQLGGVSIAPDNDVCHSTPSDVGVDILVLHDRDYITNSFNENEEDDCFQEFLFVSDECERCTLCVCLLSCGVCVHKAETRECIHCELCSQGDVKYNSDSTNECDEFESELDQLPSLRHDLRDWAVDDNITHKQLCDLLAILRFHHPVDALPKDPRALLHTPRSTIIHVCSPGSYWHNGLKNELAVRFSCLKQQVLELTFSVDGLPISSSSSSSLWPISCSVKGSEDVFAVGIYHGLAKPHNVNDYLRPLVDECVDLCNNGLHCGDKTFPVVIASFCCDAPAKAFILNVKSHNAYHGCSRCTVRGVHYKNRMCYLDVNCDERSDRDFREQTQEEYHKGRTELERIPNFDIVSGTVLDYMHLICLGVMKKLLLLWLFGKLSVRIGSRMTQEISAALINLSQFMPMEFARKPRSLEYVRRFKATEFRQIVMYSGPVVFYCMKDSNSYKNFMVLHVAVRILASPELCTRYNNYADSLLRNFIEGFLIVYGKEHVNHNVHCLAHLSSDVLKNGPLDSFSAFKFENFMQHFKKYIRKGEKPLQQIARRYCEKSFSLHNKKTSGEESSKKEQFRGVHSAGPLVPECKCPQYQAYVMPDGVTVSAKREADSCVGLSDGSVALVKNFAFHPSSKQIVALGCKYIHISNFYEEPCLSSTLGVYEVYGLSPLSVFCLESIVKKYVRLPLKDRYVVYPLLHQSDNM